jgi:putative membrane protein
MKTLMMFAALGTVMLAAPAAAQVMTPPEYVATAGASDLYEIISSQAVLQTTRNPQLRAFAQTMITQHTQGMADVKAAAARSKVHAAPPRLNLLQQESVTELRSENGITRDAAYIAQQKAAHGKALDVQKAYALEGTASALQAAAMTIVPVVIDHIVMLRAM